MLKIQPVPNEFIHQTWPLVHKFIEESVSKGMNQSSNDYNADQILAYLSTGQWTLIVAVDEQNTVQGAMTLSFINYPLNRVAFVTATGGKFIIDQDTLKQLGTIAKMQGATKIQAMARPAMERLLQTCGFEAGNKLMELKL